MAGEDCGLIHGLHFHQSQLYVYTAFGSTNHKPCRNIDHGSHIDRAFFLIITMFFKSPGYMFFFLPDLENCYLQVLGSCR